LRGLRSGSLTIGASTTPGTYLVPAALGRFHASYPGIALSLRIGDTREIERWVAAGQMELGVIGEAPLMPELVAEPWVRDELVLVSRHAVRARDPRVVAVRLAGGRWTRDLLVVHRAGAPLDAAAAKFREFLLDQRAAAAAGGG